MYVTSAQLIRLVKALPPAYRGKAVQVSIHHVVDPGLKPLGFQPFNQLKVHPFGKFCFQMGQPAPLHRGDQCAAAWPRLVDPEAMRERIREVGVRNRIL